MMQSRTLLARKLLPTYRKQLFSVAPKASIFESDNTRTSVSSDTIAMRFVVCIDPNYSWKSLVASQKYPISHPSSAHLITRLVSEYNKRPYNYNDVGEFELIMAPVAVYPLDDTSTSLVSNSPQILVYPDNLLVKLNPFQLNSTLPALYHSFMMSTLLDLQSVVNVLGTNSDSNVSKWNNQILIVVNVSAEHPWQRAANTISWINQSLLKNKIDLSSVNVLVTRDIVNGAVTGKWQIMCLPTGDRAHNLLSAQEVDRFISRTLSSK